MVTHNVAQATLNIWIVCEFIAAVAWNGHPFVGDMLAMDKGTAFVLWFHYCNKYLELLDTHFMSMRGKTGQVSFLNVYHHATILWSWWLDLKIIPEGYECFGVLFNSWKHFMMCSYCDLSLVKASYPWERHLKMAQLLQFSSAG